MLSAAAKAQKQWDEGPRLRHAGRTGHSDQARRDARHGPQQNERHEPMTIPRSIPGARPCRGAPAGHRPPGEGKPFAPVADAVKARTGREVRWAEDADARAEESARRSRAAQEAPQRRHRRANRAAEQSGIAGDFRGIGVSAADLREAGAWKNPTLDLSVRFPDRPPSSVNAEEAVIFNLLDLFHDSAAQARRGGASAAAQLRVADEAPPSSSPR